MRQDKWEKDGVQRMAVEITANSVALLGGGERQSNHPETPDSSRQAPRQSERTPVSQPPDAFPDDIMF